MKLLEVERFAKMKAGLVLKIQSIQAVFLSIVKSSITEKRNNAKYLT